MKISFTKKCKVGGDTTKNLLGSDTALYSSQNEKGGYSQRRIIFIVEYVVALPSEYQKV